MDLETLGNCETARGSRHRVEILQLLGEESHKLKRSRRHLQARELGQARYEALASASLFVLAIEADARKVLVNAEMRHKQDIDLTKRTVLETKKARTDEFAKRAVKLRVLIEEQQAFVLGLCTF